MTPELKDIVVALLGSAIFALVAGAYEAAKKADPNAQVGMSVASFDAPYLDQAILAQAKMGKGKVLLYGPEITFRGQPHATFKFLFNGLLYGPSTPTTLK